MGIKLTMKYNRWKNNYVIKRKFINFNNKNFELLTFWTW